MFQEKQLVCRGSIYTTQLIQVNISACFYDMTRYICLLLSLYEDMRAILLEDITQETSVVENSVSII